MFFRELFIVQEREQEMAMREDERVLQHYCAVCKWTFSWPRHTWFIQYRKTMTLVNDTASQLEFVTPLEVIFKHTILYNLCMSTVTL